MRRLRLPLLATLALLPAAATAQEHDAHRVGASVGYSSRFERAFVALDLLVWLDRNFALVPNGSFSDVGGVNRWTAGVELQWSPPAYRLHPRLLGWVGAGLSAVTEDPQGVRDSTTRDLVANAVAGVGYDLPASPFIQLRVALGGPADVSLSVGVRF